ncbi:MAG: major facilitator super transporter protein [Thelocarpon superellum]|nr:MAG: major facilitator super transporter protein [Thelocarpon superellum]
MRTLPQVLLLLANVLIPIAIVTFATGFFPYKPFLPGLAQYGNADGSTLPAEAPFDKVVFMVVDALRSDFVYSNASGFAFTQRLINDGSAIPFTAHATSPTITMPRVKAITTGSIPSFLDVILNFAESDTTSTLAHQDTWLAQMKAKKDGMLVMYGDDTWLKLFPHTFTRADGTSSFFVSDFTEVDNNVTRHVPDELQNADWNAMIMHYLGLDHIGHKTGPRGPHMIPKQREMDSIVRTIYQAMERQPHLRSTLLVLCGDHGMNDAGNHGGSAPGETSPALVFMSPKFREISHGLPCPTEARDDFQYYRVVEQSDIAPTLAGLLGFPVPLNNLGVFIPELLDFWPEDDRMQLLLSNARQIIRIVEATFSISLSDDQILPLDCSTTDSDMKELMCTWQQVALLQRKAHESGSKGREAVMSSLIHFSKRAQEIMSSTASNYDVPRLYSGTALAGVASIIALAVSLITVYDSTVALAIFLGISLCYGGMMFASSYVEEEQHFWYWMASAWLGYIFLKESRRRGKTTETLGLLSTVILVGLRLTRRWNQTGQKLAGEPDIAGTFLATNPSIMWTLVIATYLDLLQRVARRGYPNSSPQVAWSISTTLCLAAFSFKAAFTSADAPELLRGLPRPFLENLQNAPLVVQSRTVFLSLALALIYGIAVYYIMGRGGRRKAGTGMTWLFHDLITLFLITQTRVTNIPLYLIFEQQLGLLGPLNLSVTEISITSLLFQYLSFFAFGGSNAISSIDLSNAYNGVAGYNVLAVGLLTFISNWVGPIWWMSATTLLLLRRRKDHRVLCHQLLTNPKPNRRLEPVSSPRTSRFKHFL